MRAGHFPDVLDALTTRAQLLWRMPIVGENRVRPRHGHHYLLGLASALLGLMAAGLMAIMAPSAFANINGTFVPVAVSGSCTLAAGFSASGQTCGAGLDGNKYIYLATSGNSLTYSFTVPSGTSETLTYGIPAGGFVNNVDGNINLDGGAAIPINTNEGGFQQTTPTDLDLWTSPVLSSGSHTWTISTTGDAVNIYGLWLNNVTMATCGSGTTTCGATLSAPSQTVTASATKSSETTATITVEVGTSVLGCQDFDYAAPVVTLTDTGLESGTSVLVTDTVAGLPNRKGVLVCYQPSGASPPPPALLEKCHGKKSTGACIKSIVEQSGSAVVELLVPAGDPEYHVGGGTPSISSFSPVSPKPGKKLTIKGANLSEVTGVTIGTTAVTIVKTAPTKVIVTVPSGLKGGIIEVSSVAGEAVSSSAVTVS